MQSVQVSNLFTIMNDPPLDNPFYIQVCICMQLSEPEHQRCLIRAKDLYTAYGGISVQSEINQKMERSFLANFLAVFGFVWLWSRWYGVVGLKESDVW